MAHKIDTLGVFFQQLKGSRNVILIILLVFVASLAGYLLSNAWYLLYLIFGSGYTVLFLATMAMVTAFHEKGHVSKLYEFGTVEVSLTAHRIGNVSFRVANPEKLSPEQHYQVATAPYAKANQYLMELLFLILLILVSWYSPFLLNILLSILTALVVLHLTANICTYIVIKTKRQSGLLVSFSQALTSRGDMEYIVSWNKKQRTSG